jgi:putative oxidoreductase
MKKQQMNKRNFLQTSDDSKMIFIRVIVGLIFISEGIQKFSIISTVGSAFFRELGFHYPVFWAYFTGAFEITCGALLLLGLFTRLATIPLLVIMAVAFATTKITLIATRGFMYFAHEYNTDFALTILLFLLLVYGGGKWSLDLKWFSIKNDRNTNQ